MHLYAAEPVDFQGQLFYSIRMIEIPIRLPGREYSIQVGNKIVGQFGACLREQHGAERVLIVTDENVAAVCLPGVVSSLDLAGIRHEAVALPAGESSKSLANAELLWNRLIDAGFTRKDLLLAVGGGVVSDLTGFVAATYMRGVPFVSVPTSMMGQLDASIGGKTAVNFPQSKNVVGAFHQPAAVLTDTAFLETLPAREMSSGLGEAVKYGLLIGEEFFSFLEDSHAAIFNKEAEPLTRTLETCIRFKAGLIEIDERDLRERMVLNLGHTLGHALEKLGEYDHYRHGEAVSIGLAFACWLSERLGVCESPGLAARVESLLLRFQLPVRADAFDIDRQLETMRRDKKVCRNDRIRFILTVRPGATVTQELSLEDTRNALAAFRDRQASRASA